MDEARSLSFSVNLNSAQAETNVRNLISDIGSLNNRADSIGSAFRKSFLSGVDSGESFSSSIRNGIGGAFKHVGERVSDFRTNLNDTAQKIGHGFAHPIETIKNGLGNAVQSAKNKFIDMARGAEQATDETEDLGAASGDAKGDVKDLGNEAEKSGGKFEKLGSIVKTAGLAIGAALGVAIGATGAFAHSAVNTGMEFDSAMSQISATMGMTSKDIANNVNGAGDTFEALRDKAKEMGAATNFSATEAAEGLNILAMSGFDATDSMGMIEDVLHLAAAGSMEMSQSADFIAGSMKGFNDETKNSAYYADLMAKGATLANTSVAELGEAMSGGAATAKSYGQEADSMTLALLRLAEQGVVGSAASTSLNAAMKDLYTPTDAAKKALSELGIAVYDENGKAREFNTVVNELNGAFADMSDEEANVYKSTIFQIQGLQAFNKMTVTSTEKQEEWAAALANASGEASSQYATMTDNLQGDIDIWNSALDGFKIALSDELTPTIREFVQFGSNSMGKLTEAFEVGGISGAMGALGEILSDGIAMITDMLPSMIDAGMQLLGALGQGLLDNLPLIVDVALQIITSLGDGILQALPKIAEASVTVITTLANGIGDSLPTLIPTIISTVITIASTLIQNLPLILDAGMQIISGLAQGIINAVPLLIEQLPILINQFVTFITDNLPTIIEQGIQIIMTLADSIISAIPMLIEQLPVLIIAVVDFITENLPTIIEQGIQLILNLAMGLIEAIPILLSHLPEIISSIIGFLVDNLPMLVEAGIQLVVQLAIGMVQAIPQLIAALPDIICALVEGLAQLPGMFLDIGVSLITGLWDGICQMGQWLWDQVSGFFDGIVGGICDFLGIHSPSTVLAGVGTNMALGVGEGFTNEMDSVAEDMESAIPTDFDLPDVNAPNISYGTVTAPTINGSLADVSYNVNAVVEDFNPPDVSAAVVYGGEPEADAASSDTAASSANSNGSETVIAFSPVININVSGDMSDEGIGNISESLRETVRQLYMEFREEELERMALKQQYAF